MHRKVLFDRLLLPTKPKEGFEWATPSLKSDLLSHLFSPHSANRRLRGVLGENFLAHFDLLIDYGHRMICLDETSTMRDKIRGEHIRLLPPLHPENELPFSERLVIPVYLSDSGARQILLQLDSGSDGAILYPDTKETRLPLLAHAQRQGDDVSAAQRAFAVMPQQELRIGFHNWPHISFVTPVNVGSNIPDREEEGLLPTVLFQRVCISFADHYVIFDPR